MFVYRPRLYAVTQLAMDLLSFWPVWACGARLRVLINPLMTLQVTTPESGAWVPPVLPVALLWIVVSWRLRLYRAPHEVNIWSVLGWAGRNAIGVCALTVVTTYFSRQFGAGASRMFVVCMIPATFGIFFATRGVTLLTMGRLQERWLRPRIALVGDWSGVGRVLGSMKSRLAHAVQGVIVPATTLAGVPGSQSVRVLGTTDQLGELLNRERIEHVIVLHGSLSDAEVERCNRVFGRMGLPVSCVLDLTDEVSRPARRLRSQGRLELSMRYGVPVIDIPARHSERTRDLVKHAFDMVLALILLPVLTPMLLATAAVIRLTSKGPALETLPRVGKGGRHFTCVKFRTTYIESDEKFAKAEFTSDGWNNNPNLTAVGRFLRRYSLDELPQIINILRSEMSFVGPRPLPTEALGPDGMSSDRFAWSEARAGVRPGVTGLWQISGRGNLTLEDMIRLDLEYVQNRSLSVDISIILETPMPVLRGTGIS